MFFTRYKFCKTKEKCDPTQSGLANLAERLELFTDEYPDLILLAEQDQNDGQLKWLEQRIFKARVEGSNPFLSTMVRCSNW